MQTVARPENTVLLTPMTARTDRSQGLFASLMTANPVPPQTRWVPFAQENVIEDGGNGTDAPQKGIAPDPIDTSRDLQQTVTVENTEDDARPTTLASIQSPEEPEVSVTTPISVPLPESRDAVLRSGHDHPCGPALWVQAPPNPPGPNAKAADERDEQRQPSLEHAIARIDSTTSPARTDGSSPVVSTPRDRGAADSLVARTPSQSTDDGRSMPSLPNTPAFSAQPGPEHRGAGSTDAKLQNRESLTRAADVLAKPIVNTEPDRPTSIPAPAVETVKPLNRSSIEPGVTEKNTTWPAFSVGMGEVAALQTRGHSSLAYGDHRPAPSDPRVKAGPFAAEPGNPISAPGVSRVSDSNPDVLRIATPNKSTVPTALMDQVAMPVDQTGPVLDPDAQTIGEPVSPGQTSIAASTPGPGFTQSITHAPTAETARSVAMQIIATLPESGQGFDLALHPEELGRIRIALSTTDGGSVLVIHAERAETLELLRRHVSLLQQDLQSLGHENLSLHFAQSDGGAPHHQQQGKSLAADRNDGAVSAMTSQPPLAGHRNESLGSAERLDIRL